MMYYMKYFHNNDDMIPRPAVTRKHTKLYIRDKHFSQQGQRTFSQAMKQIF